MPCLKHIRNSFCQLSIITTLFSCEPWFAYSPYEAQLDQEYCATTEKNLEIIKAADIGDSKPFKVALLSDPHYHFSKLQDALIHINKSGDYAFAIVTGDLTENGLKQEFVFFYESMKNLNTPYLTVIGNHDYLSNGELVYGQMFGAYNYSFVFNNVKFVLFDNTTVESEKDPDLGWLESELRNDHGYDHVIPLSHIPPYDGQMEDHRDAFHELLIKNRIHTSVHGHRHDFSVLDFYGDGVRYATVSTPQKRSYAELIITPAAVEIKEIEY